MKYEITMYKLLGIFMVGSIVFMSIGFWMGHTLGETSKIDDAQVMVPPYCHASFRGNEITVSCTELEDYSALELCNMFSTSLKDKIRVVVITSD
ncbi:hypothetical protein HOF46_00340 [Candidatus Woesearchaeota archaeon]|nr:hypothetical protein [Candidatus Woesearchaeota archaeon]